MPYVVLVFVTRNPTLTSEEFRDHWENTHIPLMKSLTGRLFPLLHTRRYLARTDRLGYGGPANRDRPPLVLRGSIDNFDYDATAELTFESEDAFRRFYRALYEPETAAILSRDEELFLDTGKIITVVVGDTQSTPR